MRKFISAVVLACSILLPLTGRAAISYVGVTNSVATSSSVTTLSASVAVGISTDPSLSVCVQTRSTGSGVAVQSVTRGAQSFTLAKAQVQGTAPTLRSELWVLPDATTGTADATVVWPNTTNNQVQAFSVVQANGVNVSSPIDATSGAGGVSATPSSTITTVADGALIIDCTFTSANLGVTVGAGQTERANRILSPSTWLDGMAMSTVAKASHGAEDMNWTQADAGAIWAHTAVSLTPSGGSAPASSAPVKATLNWTNGTDGVGVTSATVLRCTGLNCAPSTNPVTIPATNGSAGTYVDESLSLNTTYGFTVFNSDGAGNPSSVFLPTKYITTGSTFRNVLGSRDFSILSNGLDIGTDFTAGYTAYNACTIVSGTVRSLNLGTSCLESYNGVATPNDQWVQSRVPSEAGSDDSDFGLWCRLANAPTITSYVAFSFLDVDFYEIYEVTNDSYVQLASVNAAPHLIGDRYRFECEGTALRFYRIRGSAETLLTSTTDATIASGKTGISLMAGASGSLADVQINSFAMGGYSATQDVAPTITGLTVDLGGANVTYGAVPPTRIIVRLSNSQTSLDVEHPLSDFPAGRLTQFWPAGWTSVCMIPVDSLGNANLVSTAYVCTSLSGVVSTIDTVPPALSGCTPSSNLPEGTTSTLLSCDLDKPAVCAFDLTDIPVLTMQTTIPMQTAGSKCSVNLTGLSAGPVTRYVGAYTENPQDTTTKYPAVTNQAVTFTILAAPAADTTDPSTVINLTAELSGLVATLRWSPATDNVAIAGYQVYQSTDGCVTNVLAGSPITATSRQINLAYNTTICYTVKAIDTSNRLSANFAIGASVTTGPFVDVFPPSDMAGLTVDCNFTGACVLRWDSGTDDQGAVTSTVEYCTVISPSTTCSNFTVLQSLISVTTLSKDLTPATRYCFQGLHSDGTNVGGYSSVVCGTTLSSGTSGLVSPRPPVRFNTERPSANRPGNGPARKPRS